MHAIDVDAPRGVLEIMTSGFWPLSEATAYADELRLRARMLRRSERILRAIVVARDAQVQSAEVMVVMAEVWAEVLTDPDDRVALVVESSLAKMQAKRVLPSHHWQVFVSSADARAWLDV